MWVENGWFYAALVVLNCLICNTRPAGRVYETLLTEHERKYGPSKIYEDLFRVIQGNLDNLSVIKDEIAGK